MAVHGLGAQGERPLPDSDAFFTAVRERLASNALLWRRYRFKERRTELKLNPFGTMGTGPVEVFQVFPSVEQEMTYRRLIERDGQPVPPTEIGEQDREYMTRYRDWQKGLEREGARDREARQRREAVTRAREEAKAKEVLNFFTFSLVRRDILNGEPTVVVHFAPKPGVSPSSREARVAAVFEGDAWVHESEFEVIQVVATSQSPVSFGWGMIARLNEGANVRMTRTRAHGVWLPSETKFSGSGRALLVRRVTLDYVSQYFDYAPSDPTVPPPIAGLGAPERQ